MSPMQTTRTMTMMRAAVTPSYGPADVLAVRELPVPPIGTRDVRVEVHASTVTAGDLRLRAADFPSIAAVLGRLAIGVRRPRHAVQGTMFAGRVTAVGAGVTRYAVGDRVFGFVAHGAYAEYLAVRDDAAMAPMPAGADFADAAALPYGAITALRFLRDVGAVRPGDDVLILGASGGVGRFAVQLARHLGARVTAVCSARNAGLVRSLGADDVIDHRTRDVTREAARFDVIFDVAGVTTFRRARAILAPGGRYLTLLLSVGVLAQAARTAIVARGGRRAKFAIVTPTRDDVEALRRLAEDGVVRAVIGARFALDRTAEAHAAAEARDTAGAIIVDVRAARAHEVRAIG